MNTQKATAESGMCSGGLFKAFKCLFKSMFFLHIVISATRLCQHLQGCLFVWGVLSWRGDTHSAPLLQKGQRMASKRRWELSFFLYVVWLCCSGQTLRAILGTRRYEGALPREATWRCCSGFANKAARGIQWTNELTSSHEGALPREDTWSCCSGLDHAAVPGMKGHVGAQREAAIWNSCSGPVRKVVKIKRY